MDPEKVQVIMDWPEPRTVKETQSFLGFANFYHRFIQDYSRICRPLHNLTWKNTTFRWNSACQSAFDLLKSRFTSAPILCHFDLENPIVVETDSSDYAIGAVLSQIDCETGLLHPILSTLNLCTLQNSITILATRNYLPFLLPLSNGGLTLKVLLKLSLLLLTIATWNPSQQPSNSPDVKFAGQGTFPISILSSSIAQENLEQRLMPSLVALMFTWVRIYTNTTSSPFSAPSKLWPKKSLTLVPSYSASNQLFHMMNTLRFKSDAFNNLRKPILMNPSN
jgi:hypothetical protein